MAKRTVPKKLPTVDQQVEAIKVLPHSIEAEQAVLGSLLLDCKAWDKIADRLSELDFYLEKHQVLFSAIAELAEKQNNFDVLTLAEYLKEKNQLAAAGEEVYLFELAKNTPSAANIVAYADIVRERSILRQLVHIAQEIADSAFHPEGRESTVLLDEVEQKVFTIAEQKSRRNEARKISTFLSYAVDRIHTLQENDSLITGLSTGYIDLDEMTSGLQPADLIIVAGRPSMGKTAFAMNIAEHVALNLKKPTSVLIFSMEMSGESLIMRLLSSLGRIDQHKIRTGKLKEEDWPGINHAIARLSEASIFIDDTAALSPAEIRARARRIYREQGGLGLIVVDYLQLMQVPGTKENRTTELSEISRNLKALAKELRVPIVALSQLNRSLEQRSDKRPVMSDLRESGALEQDADLILFIYRDEIYNENTADKDIAEIIIGKQRNGPVGKVRLKFFGKLTRFDNLAKNI